MRLVIPPAIDPGSIASWRPTDTVHFLAGETMGTTWSLHLAVKQGFDAQALEAKICARLDDLVAQMSHWRHDSVLGQFNRSDAGTWVQLPADFVVVMHAALALASRTNGAFDPAIGVIVNVWGFGPEQVSAPPSPAGLCRAKEVSGYKRLTFDRQNACLKQPGGLHLDLSGIAKGYATDAIAAMLEEQNHHHFLVEIGGELVGRGLRPDGDPWWVDLETPVEGQATIRIALHQFAVATSGDYIRGFHTIDPRTGTPVRHSPSISVIHKTAMLADAWATALTVLPVPEMREMAIRENLLIRALTRDDNHITEWLSPRLQELIE